MSATTSGGYNPRTYGKRSGVKRKQTFNSDQEPKQATTPTKRRKVSVERIARTPSPRKEEEDVVTDVEDSPPRKPKVNVTYGSPRKQDSQPWPPSPEQSPSRPARNLSRIFDALAPVSPSTSPTRLAKRMLARSRTESSIETQSTSNGNLFERTPSLPNIPSSPSRAAGPASTSKPLAPLLPLLAPTFKPTATRTYAGKFRSFLVALPASSASSNPLSQSIDEEEGFETRESYSSLRSRWGVDNSEDDPYPYASPSPTKSNTATPDISPSRNGKGKSKPAFGAVRPPPIPNGMMNPLKSISELRNKGESRRFLDEVGYLFEGMDKKGGIGLRRASALEITTKLCDEDFTRKAKVADFFSRTWDVFIDAGAGKGEDKVLDILLAFFVSLVARDPALLSELAERPAAISPPSSVSERRFDDQENGSLVGTLVRILSTVIPRSDPLVLVAKESEDAEFLKMGLDKKDRVILSALHKTINSKSNLFSLNTPISTPLLISYSLQTLSPSVISPKYLPTLLASLQSSLSSTPSTSLASTLPLKWVDAAETVPYESIYYHLRLLDTYLLGQWGASSSNEASQSQSEDQEAGQKERLEAELNRARDTWLADDLVTLGVCVELKGTKDDSDSFPVQKCLDTTLRVLVSLTHADEHWGRKVIHCQFAMGFLMRTVHKAGRELQRTRTHVKQEEDVKVESVDEESLDGDNETAVDRIDSQALDTLCLALGLLTNLVQIVGEAKQVVRETRLNPSCPLKKRACGRKCTCSQPSNGLEILVDLYAQQQTQNDSSTLLSADSPEAQVEAESSFLRGHLAVLFGLLMIGSSENQSVILAALPSPFSVPSSNAKKVKAAKRAKLSKLVEQAKDFVAFYTVVSNRLGDGEKESKVAKEVVRFLETQRDAVA